MRYVITCFILFFLFFIAGETWGSGIFGIIAHTVSKQEILLVITFTIFALFDRKYHFILKFLHGLFFASILFYSNYIFGLGFIINFKLLEPHLTTAHQSIGLCELITKNGELITKKTGTGHNSAYVECTSSSTLRVARKNSFSFKSGAYRLIWDIKGD